MMPSARARRVGIGAERRESAETLEPARLRLELKLSTLGLRPRDIPLVTVEASDRDRDPADKGDVIGFAKKTRSARSEEHTSELQSLMRISYAVFCLKKKKTKTNPSP